MGWEVSSTSHLSQFALRPGSGRFLKFCSVKSHLCGVHSIVLTH